MKLGISGQALGNVMRFDKIVQMGKKYGIFDYEIWPSNAPGDGEGYQTRNVKEVAHIIDGEGVKVYCVTTGAAFNAQACSTAENYTSILISAIDAAKELGASCVNHYCYHINLSEEHNYVKMEQYWLKALEHARKSNITLVLENEAHDGTRTPELMLAIMKHFNDPFFRTNYDATNYLHASCEGFPAAYEILKPYIGYVHLKNGYIYRSGAGQPTTHKGAPMSGHYNPTPIGYTLLSDGSVNIPGMLSRLIADKEYGGICTFEPHTKPEYVEDFYARDSAWLRSLGYFKV